MVGRMPRRMNGFERPSLAEIFRSLKHFAAADFYIGFEGQVVAGFKAHFAHFRLASGRAVAVNFAAMFIRERVGVGAVIDMVMGHKDMGDRAPFERGVERGHVIG